MREAALDTLRAGGVVAAATETLFGFLADATRSDAIDRVFELKPRADKGMPLILPSRESWSSLVAELPPLALALADAFWPGPLTIALAARAGVDPRLTLDGRIAVRLGSPSPAAGLATALGRPLTATSANPSGEPPTASASDVRAAFADAISARRLFVLDEPAPGGPPSTVVIVRPDGYDVVREGAILAREIGHIASRSLGP